MASAVACALNLSNVSFISKRVEDEKGKFDYIISRAVTQFNRFVELTYKNLKPSGDNNPGNGIFYLKGGELDSELGKLKNSVRIWDIKSFFTEPFFETKKILYLPV